MDYVSEFKKLFKGYQGAYTRSVPLATSKVTEGGAKAEVKYELLWKPVNDNAFQEHIDGIAALSIGTINENNLCHFGVIDIDNYGIELPALKHRLVSNGIPCVLSRSKSGGAHVFFFFSEAVPALSVRQRLLEIAAFLGHSDKAEIFPLTAELKQGEGIKDTSRMSALPYFGGDISVRYALKANGESATVSEFIEMANAVRVPFSDLSKVALPESDWFKDGPPCLQHISRVGIGEGMRNDTLFAVGIYCKKKYDKGSWEDELEKHNNALCIPPLTPIELQALIKSLRSKDYDYTCKRAPLKPHCNSMACRKREYGVGDGNAKSLGITGLTKIDTEPPLWLVDFSDGAKITCSTDDLTDQNRFQKRCMEVLHTMNHIIKREDWTDNMRELLLKLVIIPVPKDDKSDNMIAEYVYEYCEKGSQAHTKNDIFLGRPWYEAGYHWVRLVDVLTYIQKKKVILVEKNALVKVLQIQFKATHQDLKVGKKYCNVWLVPARDSDFMDEKKRDMAEASEALKSHVDAF